MARLLHELRRFGKEESGLAFYLVAIMLPAIIGFALLAIDMTRANNLHNDLQKGADSFAIAAAAELDGREDSIERADRALANLVRNTYRFSDEGTQQVLERAGVERRYLRSLPPNDWDPIRAQDVITNEIDGAPEAEFVEVTVNPVGFAAIFPASFLNPNSNNNFDIGAVAVAGNAGAVVCSMTPMFICNPFPDETFHEAVNNRQLYGRSIRMNAPPGNAWGPGNFGFLRPSEQHGYGSLDLARDLARGTLTECVSRRRIYTSTGVMNNQQEAGINTRFDMFSPQIPKSNSSWPPGPNIRKGYKFSPQGNNPGSNPCDMEAATDTSQFRGLTRDTSFNSQIGSGQWDYEGYLAANNFSAADMIDFVDEDGNAYSNANPPSRYDLYRYELANGLANQPSLGGEVGTPACHANVGNAERRLIHAAILDCSDPDVIDQLNGQSGAPTAIGFASFFITEPADNGELITEIVDIDGVQGRGTMTNFVREDVQLYR